MSKKTSKKKPKRKTKARSAAPQPAVTAPQGIVKVPTGITGLDEVLEGGLPQGRTTLIRGGPGTGKTVLGLESLVNGALAGEPGLIVCFEESSAVLRSNALSLGWDLQALEAAGALLLWDAPVDLSCTTAGDFGIDAFLAVINAYVERLGAQRLMIDAVDVLMRLFDDPARRLQQLCRLHDWLAEHSYTTLLTAKGLSQATSREDVVLDYLADCVLLLDLRICEQVTTRRLRVLKYRGSGFRSNEYPYIITDHGSTIMPITAVSLTHGAPGPLITSGCAGFDACLGGGFRRATGIIIAGPSGSGKTTLAATFTRQACQDGDKVLYVSFEESEHNLCSNVLSSGIDLPPFIEQGRLLFHTAMPEGRVPEDHLVRIMAALDHFGPDHLVVDAISACVRMGGPSAAFDFLIRLVDACRERGVTCLMTQQLTGGHDESDVTGLRLASVVNTLVQLRFRTKNRERKREVIVLKSRGVHHSHRYHTFHISDNGIHVDASLCETGGR